MKISVDTFGGIDVALNNAGVMDGVFPGDPVAYAKQKPLIFASRLDGTTRDDYLCRGSAQRNFWQHSFL